MSTHTVRLLNVADIPAYIALRREMLADSPWSFSASEADDRGLDAVFLAARLAESGQAIVGGFDEAGRLLGVAGLYRDPHIKMAHRARIWGVYVTPPARGAGLAARVVGAALETARSWSGVSSVGLSVSANSDTAQRLYKRLGFVAWGTEPDCLRLGDRSFDEVHMIARL